MCSYLDEFVFLIISFCLLFIACFFKMTVIFLADVIFLIYLYQRWVYPVDKKRVNEFGFAGEEEDKSSSNNNATAQEEDDKKTN